MIIYPNNFNIQAAFKWMYDPINNILLISRGRNQHKYIHKEYSMKNKVEEFSNWIRIVHLENQDFKTKDKTRILCIRPYNENLMSRNDLIKFIKDLGITSEIVFDATNNVLQEITQNFNESY
jgi:hypothetical protein